MIKIHPSWQQVLQGEFFRPYYLTLQQFVDAERSQKKIYPPTDKTFAAFEACPFENVKVVILGQDPYHGPNQAHGLSFSVPKGTKTPPSLKNIFKERLSDIQKPILDNGDLTYWAEQGVLLLNATLTVEHKKPGSHQKHGWETFTDEVIRTISNKKKNVVFLLWGNFARSKAELIKAQKHCILEAPHPSPFSAHTGFYGCQHFSKTNEYLQSTQQTAIDW